MSENQRQSLIEEAYEAIEALHRCAMPGKEKIMASLELNRRQAQTLLYLFHHDQVTIGEIAKWHEISKSLATQLVDSLVDRHLLIREGTEADRRVVIIKLAQGGKKLLQQFRNLLLTNMSQKLSTLSDEELSAMAAIGKKLNSNLR